MKTKQLIVNFIITFIYLGMDELNKLELFNILNKYEILPKNLKYCSIQQFKEILNTLNEILPFVKLVAQSSTIESNKIHYNDSLLARKHVNF
jgi:hypothetical protein